MAGVFEVFVALCLRVLGGLEWFEDGVWEGLDGGGMLTMVAAVVVFVVDCIVVNCVVAVVTSVVEVVVVVVFDCVAKKAFVVEDLVG